jgi:hypothetical protein
MSVAGEVGGRLLDAIARLDYARIEECFSEDAVMRVLTPGPLREFQGAGEAAGRFRFWFEPLEGFELVEGDVEEIADRMRIRYRFRGRDPEKGWQLNEHTGYAKVRSGRIKAMNVTCTGFRPTKQS